MLRTSLLAAVLTAMFLLLNLDHSVEGYLCRAAGGGCVETYRRRFCETRRRGYCVRMGNRCRCMRLATSALAMEGLLDNI